MKLDVNPEAIELLTGWHGGQSSATYSLMSTGKGDKQTVEAAVYEICNIQVTYKNKLSETDQQELHRVINMLKQMDFYDE